MSEFIACSWDPATALSGARRLVDLGVPPARAAAIAAEAACGAMGLGDGQAIVPLQTAGENETVKAVRDAVSPWLWVLSLTGFGMAVVNTRRIATMYRNWKRKPR